MNLYSNPKYYEIAFSYRNVNNELNFLEYLIHKYSNIKVTNTLELACGTSPYLKELNKRGYKYTGFDINQQMVKYVKQKAKENNIQAQIFKANMVNFSINNYKADFVYTLLGSLYVKSNEELFKHLDCVSDVLKTGGLYILNDIVTKKIVNKKPDTWTITKGKIQVTTTYSATIVNEKDQLQLENLTIVALEKNKKTTVKSQIIHKYFLPNELNSLIKQHKKFTVVGEYSNFNITNDTGKEDRPILVLRKN